MKKLVIIVPKGSLINSYLMNNYYLYDKIVDLDDRVCYKQISPSNSMETINLLITKFMLSDFSINCNNGDYTFRVRS